MYLTKVSPITGKENSLELDITEEELYDYINGGKLIQEAFPWLSAEEREFILTGITPEDWKSIFGTKPSER